jgi:hypothetical protein
MIQLAVSHRRGTHHERAICDRVGQILEFLGSFQQFGTANGRAGFPEGEAEGVHDTEMPRSEIAHGAGRSADVQRVARAHEHDYQIA